MKIGLTGYATAQGLGILAKNFYDNGIVTHFGYKYHHHYKNNPDWYPGNIRYTEKRWNKLVRDVDTMVFFETAFDWELIPYARRRGIKTVLMPMYECTPETLPRVPEYFLFPSKMEQKYYHNKPGELLTVPVDVPWRHRTKAEVFIHNAGNLGLHGRNGTTELMRAMHLVDPKIKLILRTQGRIVHRLIKRANGLAKGIDIRIGTVPFSELWDEGDVFVFPDKFGGLSLPLQEAHAAGMAIMSTDRYPNNTWLPKELLLREFTTFQTRLSANLPIIKESVVTPETIAEAITEWYGKDISEFSLQGKQWAEENSWDVLKPAYLKALS